MNLAIALFWLRHRRNLKARGYSFEIFGRLTASYWRTLADDAARWAGPSAASMDRIAGRETPNFSRNQLRARW